MTDAMKAFRLVNFKCIQLTLLSGIVSLDDTKESKDHKNGRYGRIRSDHTFCFHSSH